MLLVIEGNKLNVHKGETFVKMVTNVLRLMNFEKCDKCKYDFCEACTLKNRDLVSKMFLSLVVKYE